MRSGAIIYPILSSYANLTALVSANNIFPVRAQQQTTAPYIVYREVSSVPTNTNGPDASKYTSELVENGDFATASDWSTTGSWDISGGYAEATGDGSSQYLSQDVGILNSTSYQLTYEVLQNSLVSAGKTIALSASGGFGAVDLPDTVGVHTIIIQSLSDGASDWPDLKILLSAANSSGTIQLDNISLKAIADPRISQRSILDVIRVQISCFSLDYLEVENIAFQVRMALDREWGTTTAPYDTEVYLDSAVYDNCVDDFDEDYGASGIFIKHLDFFLRIHRLDID